MNISPGHPRTPPHNADGLALVAGLRHQGEEPSSSHRVGPWSPVIPVELVPTHAGGDSRGAATADRFAASCARPPVVGLALQVIVIVGTLLRLEVAVILALTISATSRKSLRPWQPLSNLAAGAVDLRKSIDGLGAIVSDRGHDVYSGHLYVFSSRRGVALGRGATGSGDPVSGLSAA